MTHVLRCSGYALVKTDIVRGQGCYLYDVAGRRYVDLEAGVWCAALGHNHPVVNRAIQSQLERVVHLGYRYTTPVIEEAAAALLDSLDLVEAKGRCLFLSSGSEAVEFGVQVARRLSRQPLLLTLADSYLAAYGSAGVKSAREWHSFDWSVCAPCSHSAECEPQCPHLQAIPFERIGGLVFEPGNASGLVRLPPRGLVRTLADRVKSQGGLLVVDEVTTGLGRTGAWYGFQHYGLHPDVIAVGKGLGNGYPVSGVVMSQEVVEGLASSSFHYAQSHQNDPLACAVAQAVIGVIHRQGLVERSRRVGASFLRRLTELGQRCDLVEEVRGRGLMIVVEFQEGGERLTGIYRQLLDSGFMVGFKPAARILRFYPPLTIEEEDVARLLESLASILNST